MRRIEVMKLIFVCGFDLRSKSLSHSILINCIFETKRKQKTMNENRKIVEYFCASYILVLFYPLFRNFLSMRYSVRDANISLRVFDLKCSRDRMIDGLKQNVRC